MERVWNWPIREVLSYFETFFAQRRPGFCLFRLWSQ